jgi:4-amino-4-deoxy-L-arabinose transferase-like glycosyltransferase
MGLGKGIWLDEAYSLDRIFSPDFLQQLRLSDHPPLYYILLKLWSQINSSEEFLRVLSVCFGVGTVAVVMKWMKQHSHISSLIAGLICTTLPLMLRYSQEIKGYPLLLFATALSFYSASRLMSKPEGLSGYLGLGFGLTIAVATHAVGVMLLMSICAYIAFTSLAWRKIRLERVMLVLVVPFSVFILLFFFFLIKSTDKDPNSWWVPTVSGGYILYLVKALFGVDQAR